MAKYEVENTIPVTVIRDYYDRDFSGHYFDNAGEWAFRTLEFWENP